MIVRVACMAIILVAVAFGWVWIKVSSSSSKIVSIQASAIPFDKLPEPQASSIIIETVELPPPPPRQQKKPRRHEPSHPPRSIPKDPPTRIIPAKVGGSPIKTSRSYPLKRSIVPLKTKGPPVSMGHQSAQILPIKPGRSASQTIKSVPKPLVKTNKVISPVSTKPLQNPVTSPTMSLRLNVREGRPLLRLLEHGKGPAIEIAWPDSAHDRRHLYRVFRHCYGMEIAVMDGTGRLFRENGQMGNHWSINMDRFSGFVRQSTGDTTSEENETANRIKEYHGIIGEVTVRVFPRVVDALLLAGIKGLVGGKYERAGSIRARYKVVGRQVEVSNLTLDVIPISGEIDLSGAASRNCSI